MLEGHEVCDVVSDKYGLHEAGHKSSLSSLCKLGAFQKPLCIQPSQVFVTF